MPYALGPVLVTGVLGFSFWLLEMVKKGKNVEREQLILLVTFLIYFLPSSFLFAKWTRFLAPSFPFFAIFASYFLTYSINPSAKRNSAVWYWGGQAGYWLLTIFYSAMFFSIYTRSDIRLQADRWINQNLPTNSFILTEAGNMLEVPLSGRLQKKSFDFYNLENDPKLQRELPELLAKADYFIIQSRRIFANHQRQRSDFPLTARFYDQLFSRDLGFTKIKEFNSYPSLKLGSLNFSLPDEKAEETWSVFDHPRLQIFQKKAKLEPEDYQKLLQKPTYKHHIP